LGFVADGGAQPSIRFAPFKSFLKNDKNSKIACFIFSVCGTITKLVFPLIWRVIATVWFELCMVDWYNKKNIKIGVFAKRLFLTFCLSSLLVSCGSIPRPDLTTNTPASWRNTPTSVAQTSDEAWWLALKDQALNETVELALKNNLSVAQSYERLNAERALEKVTIASQKPRFDFYFGPNSSVAYANYHQSTAFVAGFDLAWEVPFTQKQEGQRLVAGANIEAASAGMVGARASIVAEVVRVYGELRATDQKKAAIKKMVAYQEAIVQMYTRSEQAGAVSRQDLNQVQGRLFELQSVLSDVQLFRESILQRLDVLCGLNAPMQAWLNLADSSWQIERAQIQPFNVPAELVMDRPDVQIAVAAVKRAAGQVGIADAELYPKIGVEGAVYYSGTLIRNGTTTRDGLLTFLAPNIRIPIYDWGMAREQKNASEAEFRRSIIAYREAVLQAIADTELAIASFNVADERLTRAQTEGNNLLEAAERNKMGLQSGHLSPLEVFSGNIKLLERKLANIDDQSTWVAAFAAANKAQTNMSLDKKRFDDGGIASNTISK
jgi:outer membrane protein TolC